MDRSTVGACLFCFCIHVIVQYMMKELSHCQCHQRLIFSAMVKIWNGEQYFSNLLSGAFTRQSYWIIFHFMVIICPSELNLGCHVHAIFSCHCQLYYLGCLMKRYQDQKKDYMFWHPLSQQFLLFLRVTEQGMCCIISWTYITFL